MKNLGAPSPLSRWAVGPLAVLVSMFVWFTGTSAAAVSAPTITSPADGYSTVNRTPVFTGTAAAGETVKLDIDAATVATVANSSGEWTLEPSNALAVGEHTVVAVGCVSGSCRGSASQQLNELPSTPNITSPSDGSASADQTPPISGTADPGDAITLYDTDSSMPLGTATADANSGTWTVDLASSLKPNDYGVYAVATDANSGLESADSDLVDFKVLPRAPVITSPSANTVYTTAAASPSTQVCGTGAVGETIAMTVNGADAGSTSVGPGGTWCTTAATPRGIDMLVAVGTDASGGENPSAAIAVAVEASSGSTTTTVTKSVVLSVKQKLSLTLTNALKAKCALAPQAIKSCTITIKARGKVIGKATRTFKGSQTHSATITVKLSKSAVKMVKRAGKRGLKVNFAMQVTAIGGSTYAATGTSLVTK